MSQELETEMGRWEMRGALAALGATIVLALTLPAAAGAQDRGDDRVIKEPPTVSGPAQVTATVTATGARWEPPSAPATWQWYRCESPEIDEDEDDWAEEGDCRAIAGATGTSYTIVGADEGSYLRVLLVVHHGSRRAWAVSAPSDRVAAAPVPPPPPPPPPGDGADAGTGGVAPVPIATAPTGGTLAETVTRPARLMNPTPVVRIRGRTTRIGARITLLTVQAPKGARISLVCKGRGCPARRWARTSAITRLLRFERNLRAGTKLVIRVTKAGRIGKHTTIVIRKNRAPARTDLCLYPGRSRPAACPAA